MRSLKYKGQLNAALESRLETDYASLMQSVESYNTAVDEFHEETASLEMVHQAIEAIEANPSIAPALENSLVAYDEEFANRPHAGAGDSGSVLAGFKEVAGKIMAKIHEIWAKIMEWFKLIGKKIRAMFQAIGARAHLARMHVIKEMAPSTWVDVKVSGEMAAWLTLADGSAGARFNAHMAYEDSRAMVGGAGDLCRALEWLAEGVKLHGMLGDKALLADTHAFGTDKRKSFAEKWKKTSGHIGPYKIERSFSGNTDVSLAAPEALRSLYLGLEEKRDRLVEGQGEDKVIQVQVKDIFSQLKDRETIEFFQKEFDKNEARFDGLAKKLERASQEATHGGRKVASAIFLALTHLSAKVGQALTHDFSDTLRQVHMNQKFFEHALTAAERFRTNAGPKPEAAKDAKDDVIEGKFKVA